MSSQILSALRATPYFDGIAPGALETALAGTRLWAAGRGDEIAGGRGRAETLILASGAARVMRTVRGDRSVAVCLLAENDLFGILPGADRTAPAERVEFLAPSEVLSLPLGAFEAVMLDEARVALRVLEAVGRRLAAAERHLVAAGSQPVPARVAMILLDVGARYGVQREGEVQVDLWLTHGQIAELATTTRETVTKVLSWLRRQGIAVIGRQGIRIADPDALGRIAGGTWPMPGRLAGAT